MQDRWDAGLEGTGMEECRIRGMQERRDAGRYGCRKVWMQEGMDAGRNGCRKVWTQKGMDAGRYGWRKVWVQERRDSRDEECKVSFQTALFKKTMIEFKRDSFSFLI